jgi:hypothetical protein
VNILRLRAVQLLRERGSDDDEARESLIAWTVEKEKMVNELGTREAQIDFEIERAELYAAAGFNEDARMVLDDALMIAEQEGLDGYKEKVARKLLEIL